VEPEHDDAHDDEHEGFDPRAILDAFCDPAEIERRALHEDLTPELIGMAMRALRGDARLMVARRLRAMGWCDPTTLELLADTDDPRIRLIVARYYATPPALLQRLLADPSPEVRAGLVWNFNYRAEARRRLAHDRSDEVRDALAQTRPFSGDAHRLWHQRLGRLVTPAGQVPLRTNRSRASSRTRTTS